ncbi:MAG: acylase [bacterium]
MKVRMNGVNERMQIRRLLMVFFSLALAILLAGCVQPTPDKTEILWDTWGVPHIYGKTTEDLFYAYGWAQMHNHGNLLLRLYGQARGRAAEYWGSSYLESDRHVHTMGVPARSLEWYEAQSPDFRAYLDAFVRGINEYAAAHGDLIADSVEVVLPVTAADVLAHNQRTIHFTFVAGGMMQGLKQWHSLGSNGWAIAPARSANGHAMLVQNPHLPWSDLFLFNEAQLTAPGVNCYGATLVGLPTLAISFNDHLGWTHTVNTIDGMDLYELSLKEGGYVWDDSVRAFETETVMLKVKQAGGGLHEQPLLVRRSIHGPVVGEKNGKAVAVRLVGLGQPHLLEQWWQMQIASNITEFEAALKRLQIPMFNVVYADRDGHILYLFGGRVPKRPTGDWDYWQGMIPGNTSKTLWTETHPYSELPRFVDPATGWIQNANDPPWYSTFPQVLNADDFPSYMAPRGMGFRPQRSASMLTEDDEITFDELVQYKLSTRMELADRLLDDLIPAARKFGGSLAKQAADVLEAWDRQADTDSHGAVLFAAWYREADASVFAVPWREDAPRTTPDGLADPESAVAALEKAAAMLKKAYGVVDVPWGEVFRLRYAGKDLPANGASGELGVFRVLRFMPDTDGKFRQVHGDSYVSIVEFSDPVRARVLLSYGNATQPHSPHVGDQLELFSKKELRPVWRTREEIEAHLEQREVF